MSESVRVGGPLPEEWQKKLAALGIDPNPDLSLLEYGYSVEPVRRPVFGPVTS